MPAFSVSKSKTIQAPAEAIWPHLRRFENWKAWSPWIIAEPDCKLTYRDDGSGYGWDGAIVGAGEIEVESERAHDKLDLKLTFLKPWKSVSSTSFRLVERDGATEVTWDMQGSLPWFLFFLKNMTVAFVGMDYDRGLAMLKDIVETGSNPSRLEFPGASAVPGTAFVGVRSACSMAAMPQRMTADMEKLHGLVTGEGFETAGAPFSIYHKWNPAKGHVEYTIAAPVASAPASVPSGFVSGERPNLTTYPVRHTGPYHHIGNAWAAGMLHGRAKVFTQDKSREPFEIYENDPNEVEANDLVTVVHLPVK